jgi:N-dimethylarginine dimethylaminohydrolase
MLKSPNNSSLEKQFIETNVLDEKDVQSNQAADQHKAFYEYLQAHSRLNTQLKDLKNIH